MTKSALLDLHRVAMLHCRLCGHPAEIRPIVSVARSPKIMLVGQAPGIAESGGGPPFSGRAGATLFRWLESVGIGEETARARMYIAAITRCYPGRNAGARGDRVPGPDERANCSKWLSAELRIIKPMLLIPVGRLAIDAFLGPRPLDEVIGKEHVVAHDGGTSISVPLPHPSGASSWIHQGSHKDLLHGALELIAARWRTAYGRRRVA